MYLLQISNIHAKKGECLSLHGFGLGFKSPLGFAIFFFSLMISSSFSSSPLLEFAFAQTYNTMQIALQAPFSISQIKGKETRCNFYNEI